MQKKLIAFGLIWLLLFCVVGFVIGIQHADYTEEIEEIAAENNLEEYWASWSDWKAQAVSHAHALCFATIAILLGLIIPLINFGESTINVMGWLLIIGVILASVFELYKVLPLMVIGHLLIMIALVIAIIGAFKSEETSVRL